MKKLSARILLIILILALAAISCIGGGGDDGDTGSVEGTVEVVNQSQIQATISAHATETYGADQFYIQLTAIAESEQ